MIVEAEQRGHVHSDVDGRRRQRRHGRTIVTARRAAVGRVAVFGTSLGQEFRNRFGRRRRGHGTLRITRRRRRGRRRLVVGVGSVLGCIDTRCARAIGASAQAPQPTGTVGQRHECIGAPLRECSRVAAAHLEAHCAQPHRDDLTGGTWQCSFHRTGAVVVRAEAHVAVNLTLLSSRFRACGVVACDEAAGSTADHRRRGTLDSVEEEPFDHLDLVREHIGHRIGNGLCAGLIDPAGGKRLGRGAQPPPQVESEADPPTCHRLRHGQHHPDLGVRELPLECLVAAAPGIVGAARQVHRCHGVDLEELRSRDRCMTFTKQTRPFDLGDARQHTGSLGPHLLRLPRIGHTCDRTYVRYLASGFEQDEVRTESGATQAIRRTIVTTRSLPRTEYVIVALRRRPSSAAPSGVSGEHVSTVAS